MQEKNLPIGYWLREADHLLTRHIDQVQADNGVTRLEWQTLNLIAERAPIRRSEVAEVMNAFGSPAAIDQMLSKFVANGWLQEAAAALTLTGEGAAVHTRVRERQETARANAMAGISGEEYAATVRVLQKLVENLRLRPQG